MIRPLAHEPVRMALTVLAVALGVAVVLAIDLAGNAATGSFRSSMETLSGNYNLEITATGGVPDAIVGQLATAPFDFSISPRIEDFAVVSETKKAVVLLGLDLVGESGTLQTKSGEASSSVFTAESTSSKDFSLDESIWTGNSLGWKTGNKVSL